MKAKQQCSTDPSIRCWVGLRTSSTGRLLSGGLRAQQASWDLMRELAMIILGELDREQMMLRLHTCKGVMLLTRPRQTIAARVAGDADGAECGQAWEMRPI